MKTDVKNDPSYYSRNGALVGKDPMGSWQLRGNTEETLGTTLQAVCGYIENCLEFRDDPLPHLRKYFPKFRWAFRKVETSEEVAQIVSTVDYAILAGEVQDWSVGFFTAVRKKNLKSWKRRKMCFVLAVPSWDFAPAFHGTWPYAELVTAGASILINDPHSKLGGGQFELHLWDAETALKQSKKPSSA